jgi:type II secretory pathway pseudopilin PulG
VRRRESSAFTLLELLVAVGITAVLAGFMVAIVGNVSGFWGRTSGRLSAEAQGRFILDLLTTDLQSALYHDDGNAWLAATILNNTNNTGLWNTTNTTGNGLKPANSAGSLQGIATGNLSDARFGIAGTWLRFFTMKRGSNASLATASAPVAIAYQIVRRATTTAPNNREGHYLLHRCEVRPGTAGGRAGTLETGFNITASAYAPTANPNVVNDPAEIKFPTLNSVIGENVVDFGVRCYVRDSSTPTGLRQVFPTGNSGPLSYTAKSPSSVTGATDPFPDVIDVMVRVLTDEGGRVIGNYEKGLLTAPQGVTAQNYWWQLALGNSQVFTRRIVLNGKSI